MPTFRTELHIFRRNTPKVAQPAQSVTVFEPRDRRGAYQQHEHAEAGPHVTATALTRHALALLVISWFYLVSTGKIVSLDFYCATVNEVLGRCCATGVHSGFRHIALCSFDEP